MSSDENQLEEVRPQGKLTSLIPRPPATEIICLPSLDDQEAAVILEGN